MIAATIPLEHARISVHTWRAQGTSFVVHCILLTLLALRSVVFPEAPTLTAWPEPIAIVTSPAASVVSSTPVPCWPTASVLSYCVVMLM